MNVFNADKYWKENEKEKFFNTITRVNDESYAEEGITGAFS